MGLPQFDNSVPELVKKYYDIAIDRKTNQTKQDG